MSHIKLSPDSIQVLQPGNRWTLSFGDLRSLAPLLPLPTHLTDGFRLRDLFRWVNQTDRPLALNIFGERALEILEDGLHEADPADAHDIERLEVSGFTGAGTLAWGLHGRGPHEDDAPGDVVAEDRIPVAGFSAWDLSALALTIKPLNARGVGEDDFDCLVRPTLLDLLDCTFAYLRTSGERDTFIRFLEERVREARGR